MPAELKDGADLKDLQNFVMNMKKDFGFYQEDPYVELVLMMEEMGELVKAVRKNRKGSCIDPNSHVGGIGEEVADVLIYLTQVANLCGVDIEDAVRQKHEHNKTRVWNRQA
tara:strand:- start:30893 stop:31225 length:333 start_codon:yes stop_codon:yes gene_type:complete